MKKGPFKMPGYTYPGTSPIKNESAKLTEEQKKVREERLSAEANRINEKKAEELYKKDRAFRIGGTWDTADEETKIDYRAKAQRAQGKTLDQVNINQKNQKNDLFIL